MDKSSTTTQAEEFTEIHSTSHPDYESMRRAGMGVEPGVSDQMYHTEIVYSTHTHTSTQSTLHILKILNDKQHHRPLLGAGEL